MIMDKLDSDGNAIQIEISKLPVSLISQIDSSIDAKGKDVYQLSIVCMVNPIGVSLLTYHAVYHVATERTAKLTHIGWIHVTMQNARNVIALVDSYELTTQRIPIAMLKQNLFADVVFS